MKYASFLDKPLWTIIREARSSIFEAADAVSDVLAGAKGIIQLIQFHDQQERPSSHIGTWAGMTTVNLALNITGFVFGGIFITLALAGFVLQLTTTLKKGHEFFFKMNKKERIQNLQTFGFLDQLIILIMLGIILPFSLYTSIVGIVATAGVMAGTIALTSWFMTWWLPLSIPVALAIIALVIIAFTIVLCIVKPFIVDLTKDGFKKACSNLWRKLINPLDVNNINDAITIINNILLLVTSVVGIILAVAMALSLKELIAVMLLVSIISSFLLGLGVLFGCGVKVATSLYKAQVAKDAEAGLKDFIKSKELEAIPGLANDVNAKRQAFQAHCGENAIETTAFIDATELITVTVPHTHKGAELNGEIRFKTTKAIVAECVADGKLKIEYLNDKGKCYGFAIKGNDDNYKHVIMFSEPMPNVKIEPNLRTIHGEPLTYALDGFKFKHAPFLAKITDHAQDAKTVANLEDACDDPDNEFEQKTVSSIGTTLTGQAAQGVRLIKNDGTLENLNGETHALANCYGYVYQANAKQHCVFFNSKVNAQVLKTDGIDDAQTLEVKYGHNVNVVAV